MEDWHTGNRARKEDRIDFSNCYGGALCLN
jgi:hypothetical protein